MEGHDIYGVRSPVTCFVDISDVIEQKAQALMCHDSQRAWLKKQHGMDNYIESMKSWSARRGSECGLAYAEGFFLHQGHPHPHDDVLREILNAIPG
jgi:LmbE family N-acetylglucosaminyl deacetylase